MWVRNNDNYELLLTLIVFLNFAGLPAHISLSGISLVTTEPAPITELTPIFTGLQITVLQPINAFLRITISPLSKVCVKGLI